ncbi:hypothetical protein [Formosa sp. S-31]|uniref:hypothetical protein n=1 Tax=Formosa sp. S-31 TaxID=2790949 RepID=UPI003EB726A8
MDYHSDRFQDYSLMVFKGEQLVALFPANQVENALYSHQGLSYGGILVKASVRIEIYTRIVGALLDFVLNEGFDCIYIKELPPVYHKSLSLEFDYLLGYLPSECVKTDSYFVIDDLEHYQPNRNRKRALKVAQSQDIQIVKSNDITFFWEAILAKNLQERFNVLPVHKVDEMTRLMQAFPENIEFYTALRNTDVLAGVVLFVMEDIVHFQYSSGDDLRSETGGLDLLFHAIIEKYSYKKFVSFGSSSTDSSLKINTGLAYWKESFGAKVIPQRTYKLDLKTLKPVNLFF